MRSIPFPMTLALALLLSSCSHGPTGAAAAGSTTSEGSTTAAGSGGSGGSASATTSSGSTISTGSMMAMIPCGPVSCAANQLCVVPNCRHVLGEECYFAADGGETCTPGTKRGPQFDLDCPQPGGFACVDGCPPAPPFCVDLPAGCGGVASCGCLSSDPCQPSNSGACHDADIAGGVLSCSLVDSH